MCGAHLPPGTERGWAAPRGQAGALAAWRGPGTPPGEQSPRGPRLTALYPADDITVLVSMATASHGRLGSRSYVTAQAAGRRPRTAPAPRPPAPTGRRRRGPWPHGTGTARLRTTDASGTPGCLRSNPPAPQQHPNLAAPPPPGPGHRPSPASQGPWPSAGITRAARAGPGHRSPSAGSAARRSGTGRGPGLAGDGDMGTCTQHSAGVPGAQLGGTPRHPPRPWPHRLEGVKRQGRGVPGDDVLPAPAGDHFAAEGLVPPLPAAAVGPVGPVRAEAGGGTAAIPGRAHPVPHPPLPQPVPARWHRAGDTSRPRGHVGRCQVSPVPARAPLPQHSPGTSGPGAGAWDWAGQHRGQAARRGRGGMSGAEPSRARLRSRRSAAPLPRDHST